MICAHFTPQNEDWRRYCSYRQYLEMIAQMIARIRYEIVCVPLVLDYDPSEILYKDELYHLRKTEEVVAIRVASEKRGTYGPCHIHATISSHCCTPTHR